MRIHEDPPIPIRTGRTLGCGGCLSSLMAPLLGFPLTCGIFGIIEWSRSGSDAAAIAAFNACPAIVAELGAPIEEATLSTGCGEYEGGGSSGEAEWSMRLTGPKGSASAWYAGHYYNNNPWEIDSASVTLSDGRTLTAVPCPQPAPRVPPSPAEERGERGKRGKRR